jgi:hypothetical protein
MRGWLMAPVFQLSIEGLVKWEIEGVIPAGNEGETHGYIIEIREKRARIGARKG